MSDSLQVKTCPKCGSAAAELVDVDPGMKVILQKNANINNLPSKVCSSCYNQLTNQVSQGVKLRLEHQAKEKNRHMVWKSRVNLIRHARQMMQQKAYTEAAVSYEKYLRVLEISYDLKPGKLNPSVFGKSSRSKELTVIATTYWDLLRIYDTNPKYRNRMVIASRKLAEFIPFSPIFPDVVKKAQNFVSSSRNPDIIKDFLKQCRAKGGRCFVATAAFDYPAHPVVLQLQLFRDQILLSSRCGAWLVTCYYRYSPPVADYLREAPRVRVFVRLALHIINFLITPLVRPQHNE